MNMKTEVRKITPEVAKEMLRRNHGNRNVSENHVSFLSQQMRSGRWFFDGQPIRFNEAGRLLDGQHRLNAVIQSGISQDFLIITGIDSSAFKVMDTGKNRNSSDVFKINGVEYSAQVSVACRLVYTIKNQKNAINAKVSNSELLDFFEDNPRILDCVKNSEKLYREFSGVLSWTHIAGFMYLFGERSITGSESFFHKLCTGLDLNINSPIYLLRKKLMSDAISTTKLPRNDKNALIIKTWNAYREGKNLKRIVWNKDLEKFPTIL